VTSVVGVLAVVGDAKQEQVPGERGADRRHAVDGRDQPPGRQVEGDVGMADVEAIELPAVRAVSAHGYQDVLAGRLRCSARTLTAATAMKVSNPSGHSRARGGDRPQAWAMVQYVVAECGAVGEDRQGAKPAGGVDGEVGAVAVGRRLDGGCAGQDGHAQSVLLGRTCATRAAGRGRQRESRRQAD
jgi:hypothetical protein